MENELIKSNPQLSQFQVIGTDLLEVNEGQLDGLPANPRDIHKQKYELLKQSIVEHPEYLKYNMLKVFPLPDSDKYIVIGGNMRFRAMCELGFKAVPCAIIDPNTDIESLKSYVILDNASFGKWEWSMLANEWKEAQLTSWGLDLPTMASEINPDDFFNAIENEKEKEKGEKITVSLPDELSDAKDEIKSIIESALADYSGVKIK